MDSVDFSSCGMKTSRYMFITETVVQDTPECSSLGNPTTGLYIRTSIYNTLILKSWGCQNTHIQKWSLGGLALECSEADFESLRRFFLCRIFEICKTYALPHRSDFTCCAKNDHLCFQMDRMEKLTKLLPNFGEVFFRLLQTFFGNFRPSFVSLLLL